MKTKKKHSFKVFKLRKQKPAKTNRALEGFWTTLLLLLPFAGVGMFVGGALAPLFGVWLAGLLIWGIAVLSLSVLFFWIASDLLKLDDGRGAGMGGVLLALVWLYVLLICFIGGLIPLIWGLIAEMFLLWVVGASFLLYALILFILGFFIIERL